jgi:hypothetical protein
VDHRRRNWPEHHEQQRTERAGPTVVVAMGQKEREVRHEHDRAGESRGNRRGEDVAVVDVGELVPEHRPKLTLGQDGENPFGATDRGVRGVAPRGERVGRSSGTHEQAGHRLACRRRQLADDPIHHRLLSLPDGVGPHRAQRDLVTVEVRVAVCRQGDDQGDPEPSGAEQRPDEQDQRRQQAEQGRRLEPVVVHVNLS